MNKIIEAIKNNPVRIYSVAVATCALVDFYVDIPQELYLGIVAAALGGGQYVRSRVTPIARVSPPSDYVGGE